MGLVPEDRQRDGLVQMMSVGKNMSLASLPLGEEPLHRPQDRSRERRQAVRDVRVKAAGPNALITSLSGGNQQKVVIGKMLLTDPKVLLLDEPTRGIESEPRVRSSPCCSGRPRRASPSSTSPPRWAKR